jgi:hypothetical protein
MSFEVYLQAFRTGAPAGIAADAIRRAFGAALVELEEDFWQVRFADDASSDLLLQPLPADPARVHTISIYRPCRDLPLWQAVYRLLQLPGTLLWFPGGDAALARDPEIASALPAALLSALGPPRPVASAEDLAAAIPHD